MANTYSALKRVRQTERRTEYNRKNKTRLRHGIRAMRRAITGKDAKAALECLPVVYAQKCVKSAQGILRNPPSPLK